MNRFVLLAMSVLMASWAWGQGASVRFKMPQIEKWVKVNDGVNLRQGPSVSTPRLVYRIVDAECLDCPLGVVYAETPKKGDEPVHIKYAPVLEEQDEWLKINFCERDYFYFETPWVSKKLTTPLRLVSDYYLYGYDDIYGDKDSHSFNDWQMERIFMMPSGKYRGMILATSFGYMDSHSAYLGCVVDGMIVLFASIPVQWNDYQEECEESELVSGWMDGSDKYLQLADAFGMFYLDQKLELEQTFDLLFHNLNAMRAVMRIFVPFKGENNYVMFDFDSHFTGQLNQVEFFAGQGRASTESKEHWLQRELSRLELLYDVVEEAYRTNNVGSFLRDTYCEGIGIAAALESRVNEMSVTQKKRFEKLKSKFTEYMDKSDYDQMVKNESPS